jgi:hypothetical protein
MNPLLFNHYLKRAIETLPDYEIHRRMFRDWRNAPLFDYATSWDHEWNVFPEGMNIVQLLQRKWPFDTLRLSLLEAGVPEAALVPQSPRADYHTNFVAAKKDGDFVLMIEPTTMGHERAHLRDVWPFYLFVTTDKRMHGMRLSYEEDELDAGWGFTYAIKGKWSRNKLSDRKGILYDDEGRRTLLGLRPLVQSMLAAFSTFIADAMTPTNFLAEVRPVDDDNRRSVEWVRARTHYTLITHGHAANRKELLDSSNGMPTVARDSAGELTRMAHNRRAHKRTYRHSRFTYARGKTIEVRACWVGPKEWRDEGGRQIYKILEPVDDEQFAQLAV